MTRLRLSLRSASAVVAASVILMGAMPSAPPDDAGHAAFVRQAVPKLLGRKLKGAEEVKVLADLAGLVGREAVLRALMEEPEFIEHWTNVILDDLRVQRQNATFGAEALPDCFDRPMRQGAPDAGLARHVRNEPLARPAPDSPFNMIDLIRSALVLDDISPVFRAYPIAVWRQRPEGPGATEDDRKEQEAAVGDRLSHILLNRGPACQSCHNTGFSTSGAGSGWNRTFPIPYELEAAVYGSVYDSAELVVKEAYPIFRHDQFVRDPEPFQGPWGLAGCGGVLPSLAQLPHRQADMAGVSGVHVGVADLAQAFKEGSDSLVATGPSLTQPPGSSLLTIPPKQALAYLTAMTVAENVWEEVMGERLTIAHYFPRNAEQRDTLWELGEEILLRSGWSLKTLLVRIMTSEFFNRRSPDAGSGKTAYRLPMIFDPWVAADPRGSPPSSALDPRFLHNGQGELVHRRTSAGLLYSIAAALDWPAPPRFLDGSGFAGADLVEASGQYISESKQGRKGVDFQGLLFWESALGQCRKPDTVKADWIDRLMAAIQSFNADNPTRPATVVDVASAVKDWLVGDGKVGETAPSAPPESPPLPTESSAVAALFGVGIDTPAVTVPNLVAKVREYCGVLLKSPQFMLTGIDAAGGELTFPRLRACNRAPCSYGDMCTTYSRALAGTGISVECDGTNRTVRLLTMSALTPVAPKSAWPAIGELAKRARERPSSASKPVTMADIPEELRQTGPRHFGLAGDLPATAAEALAKLRAYRSSKAFARSHPHLKGR
jgi:hypothetical protein